MPKQSLLLLIILSFFMPLAQAQDRVLVSIHPLALIYQALMPEAPPADVLLAADQNLHDYALSINDMRKLQSAKTVFWLGDDNEAFIAKIEQRFAKNANWTALARESGEHAWLNYPQLLLIIDRMAAALSEQNPQQAAAIKQQKSSLVSSLQEWQETQQQRFSSHTKTPFLLGHNAFLPFAETLGLEATVMYFSSSSHGHTQSGAQTLTFINQRIAQGEIRCAIEEPDVSFAQLAKRHPHFKRFQLQPMANSIAQTENGFMQFMQESADILYECVTAQ